MHWRLYTCTSEQVRQVMDAGSTCSFSGTLAGHGEFVLYWDSGTNYMTVQVCRLLDNGTKMDVTVIGAGMQQGTAVGVKDGVSISYDEASAECFRYLDDAKYPDSQFDSVDQLAEKLKTL